MNKDKTIEKYEERCNEIHVNKKKKEFGKTGDAQTVAIDRDIQQNVEEIIPQQAEVQT
jgi:hypothetical protein